MLLINTSKFRLYLKYPKFTKRHELFVGSYVYEFIMESGIRYYAPDGNSCSEKSITIVVLGFGVSVVYNLEEDFI